MQTRKNDAGEEYQQEVYGGYKPHDPDLQVLMIVDNLNNLAQEKSGNILQSERETINMWTRVYTRLQITKHWNWSVINVIQQSAEGSTIEYNKSTGQILFEKLKPSVANLGNSKECARDSFLIIGLFAPSRYGIKKYEGYSIETLKDNFRSLTIIKSNISRVNVEVPLYFNGACLLLRELPDALDMDKFKL